MQATTAFGSRFGAFTEGVGRRFRNLSDIVAVLVGVLVAFLILYPIWMIGKRAFYVDGAFTLAPFRDALDDPALPDVVRNTALICITSTLLAVVIATAFAWLNERTDARIGWLARLLPLVPLLIPGAAGAVGWMSLMSERSGMVNVLLRDALGGLGIEMETGPIDIASAYGMIMLYTIVLMPIAYVVVQPALQNLDPSLEEAARVSGAGPTRTLFRVTIPAIFPSITSSILMTGIISLALFSIPVMIGTQAGIDVLSTRVFRYFASYPPRTGPALVLTMFVFAFALLAVTGQRRLVRRGRHATIVGKRSQASLVKLGRWKIVGRFLLLSYVFVSAVVPFVGLVYLSLQRFWSSKVTLMWFGGNYDKVFAEGGQTRRALVNSTILGLIVATLAIVAATVVATYVNRSKSRSARAVDGVMKLPSTTSQLVLAVGIVLAFSGRPFDLAGSRTIMILAYFVLFISFASFAANAAVGQISSELTEAAAVCGAKHGRTVRKIQLPLMVPALLGGWALVFVSTIGDVTAAALLAGTRTPVVGFRILDLQSTGGFPEMAALGVVITLTSAVVVMGTNILLNRRGINLQA